MRDVIEATKILLEAGWTTEEVKAVLLPSASQEIAQTQWCPAHPVWVWQPQIPWWSWYPYQPTITTTGTTGPARRTGQYD